MPKNRNKEVLPLWDRVIIFCEGESEEYYLKDYVKTLSLPLNRIEIKICTCSHTDGAGIVGELVRYKEHADNVILDQDIFWAVFDKETVESRENNIRAFKLAKESDVSIAFTAVAFEYWYYLHHEFTSGPASNYDELKSKYLNLVMPGYEKGKAGVYSTIKEKLPTAKQNAQRIRAHHKQNTPGLDVWDLNPYTNMDVLMGSIQQISDSIEND